MVEKELKRLEQNLLKKDELLDRLHGLFDKQSALLDDIDMETELFDNCMDEQDQLLQQVVALNEEADELYECLCLENLTLDGSYAEQIERLKALLSKVMDKTESLQKKEQSNKQKLEVYFKSERKNFGTGRRSSKAALDYFKSMNRSNVIPPQFMDQKK